MQTEALGDRIAEYRTSPIKVVVLIVMAIGFAWLTWFMTQMKDLMPIVLICGGSTLYFLGWAYTIWAQRLDVRQRGVRLRFAIRVFDIPFSEIAEFGPRMYMVNGTAQGANGIWFERRDGATIEIALSTKVDDACAQIARARQAAETASPINESS